MEREKKVWFITGTSTGFGRSLTEEALAQGDYVVATSRNLKDIEVFKQQAPERALILELDVHNEKDATQAVQTAVETFGKIDILVNNAGYGLLGAFEELTDEQIRHQFETNTFGLMNVTRAALPVLRNQGNGHIINISSVLGLTSFPGLSVYSSSKFAVEGFSIGLAEEVAPLGIKVTLVEPGAFRTKWANTTLDKAAKQNMNVYQETAGGLREWLTGINGVQPGDPNRAAKILVQIPELENPPLHLVLGREALQNAKDKLIPQLHALEKWSEVTISADFDEPVPSVFPK
ncbi:oxidoreductase [Priestia megaterium]|uniref:oxidoreductase n=1 Tax=Priestia megaterium TaxID=1404 RepID=UPI003457408F